MVVLSYVAAPRTCTSSNALWALSIETTWRQEQTLRDAGNRSDGPCLGFSRDRNRACQSADCAVPLDELSYGDSMCSPFLCQQSTTPRLPSEPISQFN